MIKFIDEDIDVAKTHNWIATSQKRRLQCYNCGVEARLYNIGDLYFIRSTHYFCLKSNYFQLTCNELLLLEVLK